MDGNNEKAGRRSLKLFDKVLMPEVLPEPQASVPGRPSPRARVQARLAEMAARTAAIGAAIGFTQGCDGTDQAPPGDNGAGAQVPPGGGRQQPPFDGMMKVTPPPVDEPGYNVVDPMPPPPVYQCVTLTPYSVQVSTATWSGDGIRLQIYLNGSNGQGFNQPSIVASDGVSVRVDANFGRLIAELSAPAGGWPDTVDLLLTDTCSESFDGQSSAVGIRLTTSPRSIDGLVTFEVLDASEVMLEEYPDAGVDDDAGV